jgi:hypothetical protein
MAATVTPLVDQILASSFEDRKAVFFKLAEQICKETPSGRPIPLLDEKGHCYGAYWPKFVPNNNKPPEMTDAEKALLRQQLASLDDADDFENLLNDEAADSPKSPTR